MTNSKGLLSIILTLIARKINIHLIFNHIKCLTSIILLSYISPLSAKTACSPVLTTWISKNAPRYHIQGVSVSIILNHQETCELTYGERNKHKKLPVTATTIFNAASISKPLTALAALHLFQIKKLSINKSINTYLTHWQLHNNASYISKNVTLKNLLSHTAGITGFRCKGYKQHESFPTLIQALNGGAPANTPKVLLTAQPNTQFLYSPAAYMIVEQALTDITHLPFNTVMTNTLLSSLQMTHSTFSQPLPPSLLTHIAQPYLPNGKRIPNGPLNFAAKAAGGLWTTPKDLSRFLVMIQRTLQTNELSYFKKDIIQQYLTPSLNPNWGLGIQVNLNKEGNEVKKGDYIGHSGWNSGYVSYMLANKKTPNGLVIMINTAPLMTYKGNVVQFQFIKDLIKEIAQNYHWK